MHAYDEAYLDDAMTTLAEMCDYAVNTVGLDADRVFGRFAFSVPGREFSCGNPKYTAGMSGAELYAQVIYETERKWPQIDQPESVDLERSPEYWAGWAYAYYQWRSGRAFTELIGAGLTLSEAARMYRLHEADITAFADAADAIVLQKHADAGANLKRLRKYARLTQKALSEQSGVSLRMIQLYEQGQNDLKKAQAETVLALADALNCDMRRLCG